RTPPRPGKGSATLRHRCLAPSTSDVATPTLHSKRPRDGPPGLFFLWTALRRLNPPDATFHRPAPPPHPSRNTPPAPSRPPRPPPHPPPPTARPVADPSPASRSTPPPAHRIFRRRRSHHRPPSGAVRAARSPRPTRAAPAAGNSATRTPCTTTRRLWSRDSRA